MTDERGGDRDTGGDADSADESRRERRDDARERSPTDESEGENTMTRWVPKYRTNGQPNRIMHSLDSDTEPRIAKIGVALIVVAAWAAVFVGTAFGEAVDPTMFSLVTLFVILLAAGLYGVDLSPLFERFK
jgi:hypothetical protein